MQLFCKLQMAFHSYEDWLKIKGNDRTAHFQRKKKRPAKSNDVVVSTSLTVIAGILLPARRYASAGLCDRNVSVHLSATSRYCVKTKKASVMISSPSGSRNTLVF